MTILISLLKMILLYFIIVVSYRLMNKRHLSDLSVMDLIVFLLLTNLIVLSMPSTNQSFIVMLILLSGLIAIQVIMTYVSSRIPVLRYLFYNKPSLIISKGKLKYKEMFERKYKLDMLLSQLREKSVKRIEDVEYAMLEQNGSLSIFLKKMDNLPIPLILDGKVEYPTLKLINKDYSWLNKLLLKEKVRLNEVFYAFFTKGRLYIIRNDSY